MADGKIPDPDFFRGLQDMYAWWRGQGSQPTRSLRRKYYPIFAPESATVSAITTIATDYFNSSTSSFTTFDNTNSSGQTRWRDYDNAGSDYLPVGDFLETGIEVLDPTTEDDPSITFTKAGLYQLTWGYFLNFSATGANHYTTDTTSTDSGHSHTYDKFLSPAFVRMSSGLKVRVDEDSAWSSTLMIAYASSHDFDTYGQTRADTERTVILNLPTAGYQAYWQNAFSADDTTPSAVMTYHHLCITRLGDSVTNQDVTGYKD